MKNYNQGTKDFLEKAGVILRAKKAVPQLAPDWAEGGKHGTQYSITLSKMKPGMSGEYESTEELARKAEKHVQFFFWNSLAAKEEAKHKLGGTDTPTEYDVLANLYLPCEDFEDFCLSFGYDTDSRKAEKTYRDVVEMNKKLEHIFTPEELEELENIN